MDDPLMGPRLKIERANEHFFHLNVEIRSFRQMEPYSVTIDREPGRTEQVGRARARIIPPPRWGVIVGDILHNLRSALDQLAWRLVEVGHGTPSVSTYFPINTIAGRGRDDLETFVRGKLKGAGKDSIALALRVQPTDPLANNPLYLLNELNRIDKHRMLHTTAHGLVIPRFHSKGKSGATVAGVIDSSGKLVIHSVGEETEVLRVRFTDANPDMSMEVQFSCFPALEDAGTGKLRALSPTMKQLIDITEGVVETFAPLLSKS